MQTMYVLQAQGLGDDENAYESIGVYNSKQNADNALQNAICRARLLWRSD